jgi:beta-ureidopropionase / N-carbamoyl-L-amino-acid hydrolase
MPQPKLQARGAVSDFLEFPTGLRIDGGRMLRCLDELGMIGADPAGGVTRLGLSAEENAARAFLGNICDSAGLKAETDPAGNLLIRRPGAQRGDAPVLLVGSHIDTVVQGGRLDGAYGVVAAIEVLRVLHDHGVELPVEMVVAGFANEEGALIQTPFWGSKALCGSLENGLAARDRAGRPVSSYLVQAGGSPDHLMDAAWPPGSIAAYLELHIEQGPSLERQGIPIGVVEGIVGRTIIDIDVVGEAQHAGTTPMPDRRDAMVAAAEIILGARRIAAEQAVCATATTGYLEAYPNVTNTIPGRVRLTAEVRDTDPARLARGEADLRKECARVSAASGCAVDVRVTMRSRPVSTAAWLRGVIIQAAETLGLAHLTMPSGAGHDAQIVAALGPIGMIFVPSRNGISHAPGEDTAPGDLIHGANVLLHSVLAAQTVFETRERHNGSA